MDDRNFDEKTAQDWIKIIEDEKSSIRETDIYPKIDAWMNTAHAQKVLDIGAGQGVCSSKINLKYRQYTAVEPSRFLVERAQDIYGSREVQFLIGNAYSLPLADNSFDAAFSIAVWHLLSDLKTAAEELARVLKRKGHFLIITAHPGNYSSWRDGYSASKLEGNRLEGRVKSADGTESSDVLYLHTQEEIIESLSAVGLQVQNIETIRNFIAFEGINEK